jgi:hypothetical protein
MAQNGKKIFGAGRFFGINNVSNPTPMVGGVMQDQTITIKRSTKSLYGEGSLAADVCGADIEVTGKITLGASSVRIVSDMMFGNAANDGQILQANQEAGQVPASSTYIVTVANSEDWTVDLGVRDLVTGLPMTRVASGPAAGQYAVAAGVYTFAAADASLKVSVSYLYTNSEAGKSVSLINQPMGNFGNFTAVMVFPWSNEQDILTLNNCLASDHEIASKGGDYGKPTFGFMAACDTDDTLGSFSFAEAA